MASVTINSYLYVDEDNNTVIPLGGFPAMLDTDMIKNGSCVNSDTSGCYGIVSGFSWENEVAVHILTLTIYQ